MGLTVTFPNWTLSFSNTNDVFMSVQMFMTGVAVILQVAFLYLADW